MRNQYSTFQKLKLFFWLVRTKLISKQARLIRFPFDLRGKKQIHLGINLTTGVGCRIEALSIVEKGRCKIVFGSNVQLNDYVHICAMESVYIGNNVLMASHIYISDNSHGCYKGSSEDSSPDVAPINRDYKIAPVKIEDNVWIGEGVIILPGVTIGKGAVIGAHSIVNSDIPTNSVAVGAPARVVKRYNTQTKNWKRVGPNDVFL